MTSEREDLLSGDDVTSRLEKTNDLLKSAISQAHLTVGIAENSMVELDLQENQIRAMTNRTRQINRNLDNSNDIIRSMRKMSIKNKLILCYIIGLLIATIVIISYLKIAN